MCGICGLAYSDHMRPVDQAVLAQMNRVIPLRGPDSEGGTLVLASYNRDWTSPVWRLAKRFFNLLPRAVRCPVSLLFGALIYVGVWVIIREHPLHKQRGMGFWNDVVDWVGGYPYECAPVGDVVGSVKPLGFRLQRIARPRTETGCNEFVFHRSDAKPPSRRQPDGSRHEEGQGPRARGV